MYALGVITAVGVLLLLRKFCKRNNEPSSNRGSAECRSDQHVAPVETEIVPSDCATRQSDPVTHSSSDDYGLNSVKPQFTRQEQPLTYAESLRRGRNYYAGDEDDDYGGLNSRGTQFSREIPRGTMSMAHGSRSSPRATYAWPPQVHIDYPRHVVRTFSHKETPQEYAERRRLLAQKQAELERLIEARQAEQEIRVPEIDRHFAGMSVLDALQEMCLNLFGEEPSTRDECKALLQTRHIHISDYVRECMQPKYMRNFEQHCHDSVDDLRERCNEIGTYPLKAAKTDVLRFLLRELRFSDY